MKTASIDTFVDGAEDVELGRSTAFATTEDAKSNMRCFRDRNKTVAGGNLVQPLMGDQTCSPELMRNKICLPDPFPDQFCLSTFSSILLVHLRH